MTPTLIIFIATFSGMLLMVFFRGIELIFKKELIPVRIRERSDRRLNLVWQRISYAIDKSQSRLMHAIKHFPSTVLHIINYVWSHVFKKSMHLAETLKGKGVPTTKGSASFFISSINDHKKKISKVELID